MRTSFVVIGIGDVHGDYKALLRLAELERDADLYLQTGDYTDVGTPPKHPPTGQDYRMLGEIASRLLWVRGNHEDWDLLEQLGDRVEAFFGHQVMPSEAIRRGPITIAGIGGNFSARWFNTPARELPLHLRKHFTSDQVEAVARNQGVSVLMAHEAFAGQGLIRGKADMGQPVLTELVDRVRPKVYLSGHHHHYLESRRGNTLAISLPHVDRSYVRLVFGGEGNLLHWQQRAFPAD